MIQRPILETVVPYLRSDGISAQINVLINSQISSTVDYLYRHIRRRSRRICEALVRGTRSLRNYLVPMLQDKQDKEEEGK
jgi:hypothetical protein